MKARPCPLCESAKARLAYRVGEAEIVRCARCAFLFRPEIPDDLKALYGEDYYRHKAKEEAQWAGSGDYIADQERLLKNFDEHVADIERRKSPGRLLDVGCAAGFLLEAARRRGWQVMGVDVSDYAVRYARETFHLDVRVGSVESIGFPPGAFDVVTAFEYIEHVADPVGALQSIRPWIKPSGLLVLTTPNAGSWQARRRPQQFDGFREQRHLVYFSRKSMERLLSLSDFEPLEIRTDLSILTRQSLARMGVGQPERWRRAVNRLAPGMKAAIRRAAGRVWQGSSMKVYARPAAAS